MSCGKPPEEDEEMPQVPLKKAVRCLRCKSPEVALAIPRGPSYCQSCQLSAMDSRFKKHTISLLQADCPRDSSALVAYSSSAASATLVSLLQHWLDTLPPLNENQPKYVLRSFEAVHVYDPTTERELAEQLSLDYTTRHQGSLTLIPLSDAFKGDNTTLLADLDVMDIPAEVKDDSRSPEDRLRAFLEPLSPTSRTSLVQHIRTQLLARIARSRGHSVLLLGHTSTRLASCTLANIALGRGWSLGEEVASLYRNSKDLIISRPLSTFLSPEIEFYNQARLSNVMTSQTATLPRKNNIDGLIQGFVNGLQEGFPATVSTIARTSEKLGLRSSLKSDENVPASRCALCHLPYESKAHEWLKINSITDLPARISQHSQDESISASHLAPHLCYGCLASLSERTKAPLTSRQDAPMPAWMTEYMISDR